MSIYGLGVSRIKKLLSELNIAPQKRINELTENTVSEIKDYIETNYYPLEGELKLLKRKRINRLINIGCFRGKRISLGLPVRGQRTRTNSRTCRKRIN